MIPSEVSEQNNDSVENNRQQYIKLHLFNVSNDLKTKERCEIIRRHSFYITVAQEWSISILITLVVPTQAQCREVAYSDLSRTEGAMVAVVTVPLQDRGGYPTVLLKLI